jgi:hypothetical protein
MFRRPYQKKKAQPKKTEKQGLPYLIHYPHTQEETARKWDQNYRQIVSIDPAVKNYGLRVERRYFNGWITTVVFDKVSLVVNKEEDNIANMCCRLTRILDQYREIYEECHLILIEGQLPQNYKPSRISQHTISYFSFLLRDKPLLPAILEVDSKLKGKILGAPKGINENQLKAWSVVKGRELLEIRRDTFGLQVLDHYKKKQDDLCDTICMSEAVCVYLGWEETSPPPRPVIINLIILPDPPLIFRLQLLPVSPREIRELSLSDSPREIRELSLPDSSDENL